MRGVAAFASTRAALVPSFLLLGAVATLSGYTFWLIARVNEATDTDSFGGAWRATFGESTSWVPSAIIVAKCFASCLTYTMVIGDSFAPILGAAAAPAWLASRSGVRVGATVEKRFPGYGVHRGTVVELGPVAASLGPSTRGDGVMRVNTPLDAIAAIP